VQTRGALIRRFKKVMALIDKHIQGCIELSGYTADYQRCLGIPGVGPLNTASLVAMYHRG